MKMKLTRSINDSDNKPLFHLMNRNERDKSCSSDVESDDDILWLYGDHQILSSILHCMNIHQTSQKTYWANIHTLRTS